MSLDVVELRNFYSQPLGVVARRILNRTIRRRWQDMSGHRIVGVGYPSPYLGLFREEAERCLAFMPAAQGVVNWPSSAPCLSSLVDETGLPLTDAAVDRILVIHALEMSRKPEELLHEVWRTLAPGGRVMLVVPNRRGIWARADHTPFGHGRPYSRGQLMALLREASFTPSWWTEALYMPPTGWLLGSAGLWERLGLAMSLPFAGVHMIEATKQLYRALPVREKARFTLEEPALAPQGIG